MPANGSIAFHLRMRIREEGGAEIRQTLKSLGRLIRAQDGGRRCSFYVRVRNRKGMMVQVWRDRTSLNAYLRSREHQVLLGAVSTLCTGSTVEFQGHAGPTMN